MPTRGPDETAMASVRRSRWTRPAPQRSAPLSAAPMARPRQRFPGPLRRWRGAAAGPRRDRTTASPAGDRRRPQQHRRRRSVGSADHVGAVVHAVAEVDVEMTRRSEHDRRPRGRSPEGVGRRVLRAEVGLDLDEARPHLVGRARVRDDGRADEVVGHLGGAAREEPAESAAGLSAHLGAAASPQTHRDGVLERPSPPRDVSVRPGARKTRRNVQLLRPSPREGSRYSL